MLGRRSFVLGLTLTGCSRCGQSATKPAAAAPADTTEPTSLPPPPVYDEAGVAERGEVKTETWTLGTDGRAITIVPAWTPPDERLPVLLAFHGRGEATKGPDLGVLGWPKDYALLRAIKRVCAPPLTEEDFEGFVDGARLRAHNLALERRAFAGLVVVCPYSPDVELRKPEKIKAYGDYIMGSVLPRARKELPILGVPGATGIDGVSLGGALALRIGLGNAGAFGTVGTLQAAIGEDQVEDFTTLARAARAKNPKQKLRLLTSTEDYFKHAIRSTSNALRAAGVEHELEEVVGPHDYPFNRGPGAIEMLLWHDRLLARG